VLLATVNGLRQKPKSKTKKIVPRREDETGKKFCPHRMRHYTHMPESKMKITLKIQQTYSVTTSLEGWSRGCRHAIPSSTLPTLCSCEANSEKHSLTGMLQTKMSKSSLLG
jgi:hypothetical protein